MSMLSYSESAPQHDRATAAGLRRTLRRTSTERIRVLLMHARNVPGWKRIFGDTVSGALRLAGVRLSQNLRHWRYLRFLVAEEYSTLSYVIDWRDAFCRHQQLDVHLCNITDLFEYSAHLRRIKDYDLIVVLHSAAGDNMSLLSFAAPLFESRRGPAVVFFGNEYSLMAEKVRFAERIGADYIATQLPLKAAEWLYAACSGSKLLSIPAALNPAVYRPTDVERSIDVGFRGALYRHSIGDLDRTRLLALFRAHAQQWGLNADIEFTRVPSDGWNDFLNRCKGTVGAEAGTYFLERDDRTQNAVDRYLTEHPHASFQEVYDRYFANYRSPVSGKAISSRHFEAVGTKTCQILVEGDYNSILRPDEHYISIRKDHSNLEEALARFKDDAYRTSMVNRTWEYVMDSHTYRHRVDQVVQAVTARL